MRLRAATALALILAASPAYANGGGYPPDGGPFTATGASSAAANADRWTNKGTKFDIVADLGGVCNSNPANATADTAALAKVVAMSPSAAVTITFPGVCIVNYSGTWTLNPNISFQGVNGGGVRLASGSTLTSGVFTWSGGSQTVSLLNMLFDANSATVAGNGAFLNFGSGLALNVRFNNIINLSQPPTSANRYFAVNSLNNSGVFSNNRCTFLAGSNNQNECVNSTGAGNFEQSDNVEVNSGNLYNNIVDHIKIDRNRISGHGYGSAIGLGTSVTDTATRDLEIANNQISGTLATKDFNNYALSGIDNQYYGANIAGNKIDGTCGPGMYIWGKSNVTGNLITNPGNCTGLTDANLSAISVLHGGSITNNGAGSFFANNQAYGPNMTYGLTDGGQAIVVGVNEFSGATKGAYNITGASVYAPPLTGTP